jgi:hypothetical protein
MCLFKNPKYQISLTAAGLSSAAVSEVLSTLLPIIQLFPPQGFFPPAKHRMLIQWISFLNIMINQQR